MCSVNWKAKILNDEHQEAVASFKALYRISAKANEKGFENICHNGWYRSCRELLEDKSRASETCLLQREIRLQSVLNTTERLIDLPWEAGIYSTVEEITCWSEQFRVIFLNHWNKKIVTWTFVRCMRLLIQPIRSHPRIWYPPFGIRNSTMYFNLLNMSLYVLTIIIYSAKIQIS